MTLIIINDPVHKNYEDLFSKVLQIKPRSIDVFLNCSINTIDVLDHLLNKLYTQIRHLLLEHNYSYDFNVDILFNPIDFHKYEDIYLSSKETDMFYSKGLSICVIPSDIVDSTDSIISEKQSDIGKFSVVAVGGTFDHIHDGHKILLSCTVFLSKKKVIIGVTDDDLLKKKQYKEYLESFETRVKITNDFVRKIASKDHLFDIYKIVDVCGPTGYLKDIDCLVLSKESEAGGEYVNNYRKSINYPELTVFVIDIIGGENKLSSTDLRKEEMLRKQKS